MMHYHKGYPEASIGLWTFVVIVQDLSGPMVTFNRIMYFSEYQKYTSQRTIETLLLHRLYVTYIEQNKNYSN